MHLTSRKLLFLIPAVSIIVLTAFLWHTLSNTSSVAVFDNTSTNITLKRHQHRKLAKEEIEETNSSLLEFVSINTTVELVENMDHSLNETFIDNQETIMKSFNVFQVLQKFNVLSSLTVIFFPIDNI